MPTIGIDIMNQKLEDNLKKTSGNRVVSHDMVICLGRGEDREEYEKEV
jgi:hypothetical protein